MNTTTKQEREQLISTCRGHLERGMPAGEVVVVLRNEGISRDRARAAVAAAQRRMRGEAVRQRNWTRLGIGLDDASLEHIRLIEQATHIDGASAVIREALRRMAAEL